MLHHNDPYQDIRDAVRDLCAQFPDEYHRKVDEQRGYRHMFAGAQAGIVDNAKHLFRRAARVAGTRCPL